MVWTKSLNLGDTGPVHTAPEKFGNEGFSLRTHQMFSVHTTLEKCEKATIIGHLDLCLSKTRTWKSRDYGSAIVYGRRDNLFYRVHTTWFFFSDWTITSEAPRYPSRIVRRAVVSWTRNAHEMHEDKTCYSQFEYLFRGFLFFSVFSLLDTNSWAVFC